MMKTDGMHRWIAATLLGLIAMAAAPGARADLLYLRAESFNKTMPDGIVVPMWGFVEDADGNFATTPETPTAPGPTLTLSTGAAGDTLIVLLKNNLPEPVSLVIPGQNGYVNSGGHSTITDGEGRMRATSFVNETQPGQIGIYAWMNVQPGTCLYHSGSHAAVQVQMGLYGMLKRDTAIGMAYTNVPYDAEATLVLSEIDTNVHNAVANGTYGTGPGMTMSSTIHSRPQYFLVNGEGFTNSVPPVPIFTGLAGRTNLLRVANAGLDAHIPVLNGLRVTAVAEDGRAYPFPRSLAAPYVPALKTMDLLVVPSAPATVLLHDRALGLVNGMQPDGGMRAYLQFVP